MIEDKKLLDRFEKDKKFADKGLAPQRKNTKKCQAFYAGDFMDYIDSIQFKDQNGKPRRMMTQITKVQVYVDAVAGHFAQNRRKPKYSAMMEDSDVQEAYSKYANALSEFVRDNANADQAETEADDDMLINGYGAIETAMSYGEGYATDEPNGEIMMGALDPDSVWWDPAACAKNLLDARFCGVTKQYDAEEAEDLFNAEDEDFETAMSFEGGEGYKYDPTLGGNYDRIKYDYFDEKAGRVNVHFYHWYEIEKYYRAENPLHTMNDPYIITQFATEIDVIAEEHGFDGRAEQLEIPAKAKSAVKELFDTAIELFEFKKKVYYSAIISGERVFTKTLAESQQGFKIKFKTGRRDKKNKMWVGMVNSMMEPTLYYNKALTELMFTIASNSKGGVIVEEDAVEDITTFEADYAKTDGVVVVNSGAIANGKIKDKKTPFQPTGYEQIIGFSDANISGSVGIDDTFLGYAKNTMEAASLQRQRVQQTLTVFAKYVDSISLYAREQARLMLDYLRIYAQNNRGALFNILGENGALEFARISDDIMMNEYAVEISDAPMSVDEKADKGKTLADMALTLISVGDPSGKFILAKALRYMNIEGQDAREIAELLAPEEESIDPAYVKQLEDMIQQITGEEASARVELTKSQSAALQSKARLDAAKIAETAAKTEKTTLDTEQTDIENTLLKHTGNKNITVHT